MPTDSTHAADEATIRAFVSDRVAAIAAKDLDALTAHLEPDVMTFDVIDPLRNVGAEGVRERTRNWLDAYPGPIGYEARDVSVTVGADVAFCTYLYHVSGTLRDGGKVDMWVRATVCFRKEGDDWLVVHEHDSAPFDPKTGKASLDLAP